MGFLIGVVSTAAVSALAEAGRPAGLVLSYSGALPDLAPYSEIIAGSQFNLGADTLTFVHYSSCKTVEISGGKISIGAESFKTDGLTHELQTNQCPEQVVVRASGVSGGVLMRSALIPSVPPRLMCMVTGLKSKAFSSVQIISENSVIAQIPLTGPRIALPASAPSLRHGKTYTLNFISSAPTVPSRSVVVQVSSSHDAPLCVLRLN